MRIIIVAEKCLFQTKGSTNCRDTMTSNCQDIETKELVDILAQKTQIFTQLLVAKKFDEEYRLVKKEIQKILAEIEMRKEKPETIVKSKT